MPETETAVPVDNAWLRRYGAPRVGEPVIVCDEKGVDHHGLVTACWDSHHPADSTYGPMINAVYVSEDEHKTDSYGRQLDRHLTSLYHAGNPSSVHGRYWRYHDEERNAYVAPST